MTLTEISVSLNNKLDDIRDVNKPLKRLIIMDWQIRGIVRHYLKVDRDEIKLFSKVITEGGFFLIEWKEGTSTFIIEDQI